MLCLPVNVSRWIPCTVTFTVSLVPCSTRFCFFVFVSPIIYLHWHPEVFLVLIFFSFPCKQVCCLSTRSLMVTAWATSKQSVYLSGQFHCEMHGECWRGRLGSNSLCCEKGERDWGAAIKREGDTHMMNCCFREGHLLTGIKGMQFTSLSSMAFYSYVIILRNSYRDWSRAIRWGLATIFKQWVYAPE